jgi:DNA polymerase-4
MDAFFASVEQRDFPELRGKPIIVGGSGPRGVAAAASYEARKFGVRSAMPTAEALRRCPQLICVPGRMSVYQDVSKQVFKIFDDFTPIVQGVSVDEAYLDVSGCLRLYGSALAIAQQLKARIKAETQLTASVGIAPNKLVAKIASDLDKPDGIVEIIEDELPERLDDLPVKVIPGIGKVTLEKLNKLNIHSMRDLRLAQEHRVRSVFGKFTTRMQEKAAGIDNRAVYESALDKSISHEITFDKNIGDMSLLLRHLQRLNDKTASRLRKKNYLAGKLQIKLRTPDFQTFTRQMTLQPATNESQLLLKAAQKLLHTWFSHNADAKIRLLGVGVGQLSQSNQMDLFGQTNADQEQLFESKKSAKNLDKTMDEINNKFGKQTIKHGQSVNLSYTERQSNKIDKEEMP